MNFLQDITNLVIAHRDRKVVERICEHFFALGFTLKSTGEIKHGWWMFGYTNYIVTLSPPPPPLNVQLQKAIEEERFEEAAALRDKIKETSK
jgi:hypothetical protein